MSADSLMQDRQMVPEQKVGVPEQQIAVPEQRVVTHKRAWLRVLAVGLLLFVLGIGILVVTGNTTLFPTVVLLGNFTVPAAYVVFFYERRNLSRLSLQATALSFFWGGVLAAFVASLLEPLFVQQITAVTVFVVAMIEEAAKILGVLAIARRHQHSSAMDGIILGAAAGMGFAALESIGYTFNVFWASGGNLTSSIGVTLVRGLLASFGHGVWTAILAGTLFRESGPGRFRLKAQVVAAYVTVVILHGLWDLQPLLVSGLSLPGTVTFVGEAAVGAIGLAILWRRWRQARRLQEVEGVSGGF